MEARKSSYEEKGSLGWTRLGDGFREVEMRVSVQVCGVRAYVCVYACGDVLVGGVCTRVGCVYRCVQSVCVLLGVCDCVLSV